MILKTSIFCILLLFISQIDSQRFHAREDSLTVMRERCAKTPYVDECTRVKQQMEDLLRKCAAMVTPVPACNDVKSKYCFIWPTELYCFTSNNGGGQSGGDSDWSQIPYDSNELKQRGDYCATHQAEQKCRNLLNALRVRYEDCSKRPKTDASCQSFKFSLCSAFPKFSPCLNGSSKKKRQTLHLQVLLRRSLQALMRRDY